MKIRNVTCLVGALFGALYTAYGIYGAYHSSDIVQTEGMKLFEGVVLCAFTIPFGAVVGLGIGLLLEGLFNIGKKPPGPRVGEDDEDAS